MTDLARQLARLSPEHRALLQRRMAAQRPEAPARDPDLPAPLSAAQRRLWFVQQMQPEDTAYNMVTALRLTGPLDPAAMTAAWDALVRRHEALRLRFTRGPEGEPLQVAGPAPALAVIDTAPEPLAAARSAVAALAGPPYDLSQVPVRAGLIRLGPADHVLAIGLHHILADRWSLGLIIRDLAVLYEAARRGAAAVLPPLPLQIPDVALRQQAKAEELARQRDLWRDRLAGAPVLDLPRDRHPQPGAGTPGGVLPFTLPEPLVTAARALVRQRGISLYTLLLTAFAALMSRYGDTDDLVIGSDVSGRAGPEVQAMVGPLVNTLALRFDLSGRPGLTEALDRSAAILRAAYAGQDVPLDEVVEAVSPERRPGEMNPLFRAKFDLQQAESLPDRLHDLQIARFPFEAAATKYELRFNLEDDGARLSGRVEYRADLYDAATVARLVAHFERLLAAMLAAPEAPLASLPLLTAAEQAELLALAEGPPLAPLAAPTLPAAFEAQVDRAPEAAALWDQGSVITYGDLDARANAVAAALIARGLAAETRVAICMGRSPALLAAILGVLKAGCAYVPIDPAYPPARIALIATDAEATIWLTDGPLAFPLPDGVAALDATALPPAPRPAPRGTGDALAVVIYTSGSTGRPKGVALEHSNILARIAWAAEAFTAADRAGVLFGTSISFDLSLFEIFATLGLGGRLVMAEGLRDLPRQAAAGVTMVNSVPSLMRDLLRDQDLPESVRVVNLAGEVFPPALLDRLREGPGRRVIHNLYGPTEDAIYDAGQPVQNEPERPLPIGRPLPGTRIHILDRHGALLPRGVAGEVCLAGAGVARGYLNRPDLTAERFRPDPFGPGRLYRSGDRARWRPDGRIDIQGRIDGQVKIRGLRIEIGEIETALELRPDVAEAVVLATGAPGDPDRRLVAHVVPAAGLEAAPTAATLRAALAARLPAHLLPGGWHILPALPRLPNGKVDRRALADLDPAETRPPVAPMDATEARVVALWSELLGQDGIGVEDDFFARGGHSLLAMRLLVRLQQEFGVELALGQMFEALTPRLQARAIAAHRARPAAADGDDPTAGLSDVEVEALLARMNEEGAS